MSATCTPTDGSTCHTARKSARRGNWQIFGWPLAIGTAAIAGLVMGLTGDGPRDVLAVALLCPGPVMMLRAWPRR